MYYEIRIAGFFSSGEVDSFRALLKIVGSVWTMAKDKKKRGS